MRFVYWGLGCMGAIVIIAGMALVIIASAGRDITKHMEDE
jgi:hypothetical protein